MDCLDFLVLEHVTCEKRKDEERDEDEECP